MKIETRRSQPWRTLRVWTALFAALLCIGTSGSGRAQGVNPQDYTRITQVPRADMDAWLRQEVAASGGDWSKDRYHFYIGFSTGHFGQDPVHAIAMRRVAFSLMNNSLAVGDRVTPLAWEMTTWNVGPAVKLTDDPATRAEFVNQVPYAPHSGSQGGHDIERVLYETITKSIPADEAHSAVVLLLTNSNASQSPTGEKASLFGADNPELTQALQAGGYRLPLVRKEFRLQAGDQTVTVSLTALFPKKLVSLPDAPGTPRYPTFARETWQPATDKPAATEPLPNPTQPNGSAQGATSGHSDTSHGTPPPPARPGIPLRVWILVAFVVLAIIAALILLSRRAATKPIEAAPKAPPLGPQPVPIPGSLTVIIGPNTQPLDSLKTLTTMSAWTLEREADGKVVLVDVLKPIGPGNVNNAAPISSVAPATPTGSSASSATSGAATAAPTSLAKLAFDAKRVLRVEVEGGAQFVKLQGTAADQCTSRLLLIEPGKKVFGRVLPPDTSVETRIEINYDTPKG
ncbi:MAG: hypothetical protein JWL77_1997 [Chthonomonadaceae bacterium]|nr:hypothetical protein [Chthonomonadaceae bacterium]